MSLTCTQNPARDGKENQSKAETSMNHKTKTPTTRKNNKSGKVLSATNHLNEVAKEFSEPGPSGYYDPVQTSDDEDGENTRVYAGRPGKANNQRSIQEMFQKIKRQVTEKRREEESKLSGQAKRVKVENVEAPEGSKNAGIARVQPKAPVRCKECLQDESTLLLYSGHPNGAITEVIALTDPRLPAFAEDQTYDTYSYLRPQHKLTHFSVYDKNGHLCQFETGVIERDVHIFCSGYIKPIYAEDSSINDGVVTCSIGPINAWRVTGFDGGDVPLISLSTEFADYFLMEPSEEYTPIMQVTWEKIYLSKVIIEFLIDDINATYEDLLNKIQLVIPPNGAPKLTEESLLQHAQFICEQIVSFDSCAEEDEQLLITSPCVRALIKLTGVSLKQRMSHGASRRDRKPKKPSWMKATTTHLVRNVFENVFADQIANSPDKESKGPKRRRCGICETCQQPDCGECQACKDKVKFGGPGKSKQACIKRRCPNMAIEEANESDPEDNDVIEDEIIQDVKDKFEDIEKKVKDMKKEIKWIGEPVVIDNSKTAFYKSVDISGEIFNINDCVMIKLLNPALPIQIARIKYMWEAKNGKKMFHGNWFSRGSDTILGEIADPQELFLADKCYDVPLTSIRSKATVIFKEAPDNWSELGNVSLTDEIPDKDESTFFCQKFYVPSTARFKDPLPELQCPRQEISHCFCSMCLHLGKETQKQFPELSERGEEKSKKEVLYGKVKYNEEEYQVGSGVYLYPGFLKYKYTLSKFRNVQTKVKKSVVDEDIYPEYYRKSSDYIKGSNDDTPEPFHIGYISAIFASTTNRLVSTDEIWLRVHKLYRPENTHKGVTLIQRANLNMLYWSEEICIVPFKAVAGKCQIAYSENLYQSIESWSTAEPNRFYFSEAYNIETEEFDDPPYKATLIGETGKGKGKGKKVKNSDQNIEEKKPSPEEEYKPRRLKTLDVFAGCGGLSEGLHRAGIAESHWAIEKEDAAAFAYRLNYQDAIVFNEDCNIILQKVMNGEKTDDKGQRLPQRGEVELLCGGPPCQGFSGMNRFNSRQYSLFKNSLVASYLSYCDYYRPKFFIMENVRNFVSFKKSMVLKLTLRCLVKMGYQCTFGILQAGNYGVPQTRRRMIILAAAPGEVLPLFPEPTHAFSKRACQLNVVVDGKRYSTNCKWTESAPYRSINVWDSMSDLPNIKNGHNTLQIPYEGEPLSHFQRKMRGTQDEMMLKDHICKDMAPLVEARMAHIPTSSGSDWRDLPNIVLRLKDGTYTQKLRYTYNDKKAGRSSTGAFRGVCSCSEGRPCSFADKQFNTLIPWCLPHTGNRHNHWSGLYGRLEWNGFFSTTVTNPEPMGKQGRVLHPEQTRVVSVRECARSQGFPDSFHFYGNVLDKHRQIGNAVPPPLGAAIGFEIKRALFVKHLAEIEASRKERSNNRGKAETSDISKK